MARLVQFTYLAALPIVATYRLVLSAFRPPEQHKTWRRVVFDSVFRWICYTQPISFFIWFMGPTHATYLRWTKQRKLLPVVDHIDGEEPINDNLSLEGDGASGSGASSGGTLNGASSGSGTTASGTHNSLRPSPTHKVPPSTLLWVGPKRSSKLILYLHGGGFVLPLNEDGLSFFGYVQQELAVRYSLEVGLVLLDYTLVPAAYFPTQLHQTVLALNALFRQGVSPGDIVLVGDSAGANLVMQLLLHIVHPVEGVPGLALGRDGGSRDGDRFAGAYLMSPWTSLLPSYHHPSPSTSSHSSTSTANSTYHADPGLDSQSYHTNELYDVIDHGKLRELGELVMGGVERRWWGYLDLWFAGDGGGASHSSDSSSSSGKIGEDKQTRSLHQQAFYAPLPRTVSSLLVSAGTKECLCGDIVKLVGILEAATSTSNSNVNPNNLDNDYTDTSARGNDSETDGKERSKRNWADLILDQNGVHDDPFYDYFAGDGPRTDERALGERVIRWCAARFGVEFKENA